MPAAPRRPVGTSKSVCRAWAIACAQRGQINLELQPGGVVGVPDGRDLERGIAVQQIAEIGDGGGGDREIGALGI